MPLKLKKRGEIWHYAGTVAGRRLRGSTKTTQRAEAEKIANQVERRWLDRDRYGIASTLTFAQASIEYRKQGRIPRYLEMVEDHWQDTPIKDITGGAIRRAAIALLPKGSGANRNRSVIVPTQAVINHCAALDLCPPVRVKRFPEPRKEREPATWDWVQAFMANASPHLGALACFMFLTGARISEALGVTWGDVDLGAATVRIRMGKLGGEERIAHMPPPLVAALANIPSNREDGEGVFPYSRHDSVRDPWRVAVKRAGIKLLTPHCCRHGFATGMLHAGVDIITVARKGGWKSPDQLFRTYGHARPEKDITNLLIGTPQTQATNGAREVVEKKRENG